MRQIRHPLSGALYDLNEDGTVTVTKDGREGRFTPRVDGSSGEIRSADPQLCGWIAGPAAALSPRSEAMRSESASRGISYQQLLDTDTHAVPEVLRLDAPADLGHDDKPVARYTTRAFHELEVELLWKKVWQMACREEDIPDVGDTTVYSIAHLSILIVRSAPTRSRPSTTHACTGVGCFARTMASRPSCAARSTDTAGTSTGP